MNRRDFLKTAGGAAALFAMTRRPAYAFSQSPALSLYSTTLRGIDAGINLAPTLTPGGIPLATKDNLSIPVGNATFPSGIDHYSITIGQFTDQLHPSLPKPTTLWGYSDGAHGGVQRHLGGLIVAERGRPVQLTFTNTLPNAHILPVDTSVPGANQAHFRAAVHLHGGNIPWISDGGPFDWWAPDGTSGPSFMNRSAAVNWPVPVTWTGAQAEYLYPNVGESARLMWYHDHAWGITRLNAYAGVATGYVVREYAIEAALGLPCVELGQRELALVVQDKVFKNSNPQAVKTYPQYETPNGDLWYPYNYERNRWALAGRKAPRIPSCVPEFFGDTMLVNGTVYPTVTVEPRKYRFRMLNACNARFLNVQLLEADNSPDGITMGVGGVPTNIGGPQLLQVGNEAGFLPAPVFHPSKAPFTVTLDAVNGHPTAMTHGMMLAPAERSDFIIDFFGQGGKAFILYTDCPSPFPGGDPLYDFLPKGTGFGPNTRIMMRFVVAAEAGQPADLPLNLAGLAMDPAPFFTPDGNPNPTLPAVNERYLTLNEDIDPYGRLLQVLGTNVPVAPGIYGREQTATATECVSNQDVEIWNILNTTADTHPMHFHLVNFQIVRRQAFDVAAFLLSGAINFLGTAYGPDPNERGWKETIRMNPGEMITVITKFDLPALPAGMTIPSSPRAGAALPLGPIPSGKTTAHEYVWHCHILEHEEHDMMRPLVVYT